MTYSQQLMKEYGETIQKQQDEIAQMQSRLSDLTGYKYPSRAIVEYALQTQQGSSLNIPQASTEFFKNNGKS